MLIVLGGLKGSGRRALAKELAAQRGFHWYDTKQHRVRGHFFTKDGTAAEYLTGVFGDEAHLFLLQKVAGDLPLLSKTYNDVVLDYPLNRRSSRDFFLKEAQRSFSPVVFVWIQTSDADARLRLHHGSGADADRRLKYELSRRERAIEEYEPVETAVPEFINEGEPAMSAVKLSEFIDAHYAPRERSLSGS
jgi:predicted kinase